MATTTQNLGLIKPAGTDKIRIAQINSNMDTLDAKIGPVGSTPLQTQATNAAASISAMQSGMAIICNGNTHAAIAEGQYAYVRNHSSLAEGLYKATAAVAVNATLSTSNLTAVSGGGLNALKAMVADLSAVVVSWDSNYTPTRSDVAIVYKKGQTCQFIAWNLSFANNMTSDTIVGTIPAGYRPLEKTSFFGYNRRQELCRGWIGPDGGLRISLYPGELMYFSVTYIAA